MKTDELYDRIMTHFRTGQIPSLPVVFAGEDGRRGVTWFYYCEKEEADRVRTDVRRLAVADEELNCQLRDVDWSFDLAKAEDDPKQLSLEEFYELLEPILGAAEPDPAAMWELLAKAVPGELLEVYRKVLQIVVEQLQEILEEEPELNMEQALEQLSVRDGRFGR